jgi:hypothetical protein
MKKIRLIIGIILVTIICVLYFINIIRLADDNVFRFIMQNFEVLLVEFKSDNYKLSDLNLNKYADDKLNLAFATKFVKNYVEYRYDKDQFGYDEHFQYPWETVKNGFGDCEDSGILIYQLAKTNLKIKMILLQLRNINDSGLHIVAYHNGIIYDGTSGEAMPYDYYLVKNNYKLNYIIMYDEVFQYSIQRRFLNIK